MDSSLEPTRGHLHPRSQVPGVRGPLEGSQGHRPRAPCLRDLLKVHAWKSALTSGNPGGHLMLGPALCLRGLRPILVQPHKSLCEN